MIDLRDLFEELPDSELVEIRKQLNSILIRCRETTHGPEGVGRTGRIPCLEARGHISPHYAGKNEAGRGVYWGGPCLCPKLG